MRALLIASPSGVEPERHVAGLGLALRALLTLQGCGVGAIGVVGAPALVDELATDPRVTVPLSRAEGPLTERSLVARHDQVVAPAVFEQLLVASQETEGRIAVRGPHGRGPAVLCAGDEPAIPARDAEDVTWLKPVDFVHDATTAEGRRAAVRALFRACRKPVDGIVSRNLNRHVSLFISRLIVDTPISPNAMTVVTFGVALVASFIALDGSYASFALAGVLMQVNSILDGCDGELARVRLRGSALGEWLDTIGDDLSNVLFWAAVGFGARGVPEWGLWLARAGWLAAGANGLAALANYAVLSRLGRGDFYALREGEAIGGEGLRGAILAFFDTVLRQDFFLFGVMIVALLGWLPWALPVIALGAVITMGASLVRAGRFFGRRRGSRFS